MILGYSLDTTSDLLNMTLTSATILLTLALLLVLARVYKVLGKVNAITEEISEIVEVVNHYLWQPARIMMTIFEKLKKWFSKKK
ncbi:hypothetical protein HZA38_01440 [Candidatus Peregrinibacteria bacterium]|nr:hypothetical protein [Candidatus Peregrinibacteria bacterium]